MTQTDILQGLRALIALCGSFLVGWVLGAIGLKLTIQTGMEMSEVFPGAVGLGCVGLSGGFVSFLVWHLLPIRKIGAALRFAVALLASLPAGLMYWRGAVCTICTASFDKWQFERSLMVFCLIPAFAGGLVILLVMDRKRTVRQSSKQIPVSDRQAEDEA